MRTMRMVGPGVYRMVDVADSGCGGCAGKAALTDKKGVAAAVPTTRDLAWACGVTTVPSRATDLLPMTLKGLARAGFPKPWLFVDGATPEQVCAYDRDKLDGVTFRSCPARVHGNWWLALHELFVRHPLAERYMVAQDDVRFPRNLRAFLDHSEWPGKAYLNLYTGQNERYYATQSRPDLKGWCPTTQRGKGALALVFDRAACLAVLRSEHMLLRPVPNEGHKGEMENFRRGDWIRGQHSVDGGVVEAMRKAGFQEWQHIPSLVQHAGLKSSFSGITHPLALDYPGDDFDALDLL